MKNQKNYLTFIGLLFIMSLSTLLASCKKGDESEALPDKTALLLGTWIMTETTDPSNAPVELKYTFEEGGSLVCRVTVRNGRVQSIIDATWRFTDEAQTLLELTIDTVELYTIEVLDETTLRLNDNGVIKTFTRE